MFRKNIFISVNISSYIITLLCPLNNWHFLFLVNSPKTYIYSLCYTFSRQITIFITTLRMYLEGVIHPKLSATVYWISADYNYPSPNCPL